MNKENINKRGISVLMSIYVKESPIYFRKCLDSILNQTLSPDEIVLVKDGPLTIDLDAVINEFCQKSALFKIISLPINKGLSNALNIGLENCSSKYVARMDTDDICFPRRLEEQYDFLKENPNIDVLGSFAIKIDEEGTELDLIKVPISHEEIYKNIWTCPFIHPTVMFNREKIIAIGSYNPNSGPRQDDYELWFRCAFNNFNFANIDKPLLYYRFFSDSVKRNNIKVGWHRLKVGIAGCRKLSLPMYAYLGVCFPFIRSLFPYPFNVYLNNIMNKLNPRNK